MTETSEFTYLYPPHETFEDRFRITRRVLRHESAGIVQIDAGPFGNTRVTFPESTDMPIIMFAGGGDLDWMNHEELEDDDTAKGYGRMALQSASSNKGTDKVVIHD